jgi:hypothetical protein
MRIYVVNATGQNKVFNYRLDYLVDEEGRKIVGTAKPYRTLTVPARQQIQLGGDWDPIQAQTIIEQLEEAAVGGVHVNNVRTAKKMGLVRLVWNEDKAINRAICDDVFHHNVSYLSSEGERRRRHMALANSVTADTANDRESSAFSVEVETVEEGTDSVSPSLNAGYRVNKQAGAKQGRK